MTRISLVWVLSLLVMLRLSTLVLNCSSRVWGEGDRPFLTAAVFGRCSLTGSGEQLLNAGRVERGGADLGRNIRTTRAGMGGVFPGQTMSVTSSLRGSGITAGTARDLN